MKRKHLRLILIATGLISALAISLFFLLYSNVPRYENVAEINKKTNLVLTLPTKLPPGSAIKTQPTYQSETGVTITVLNVGDAQVTISQQKRPATDLKQVDAQDTFLVEAGSVYILKGETGRFQAIVETSDSWLMVNADSKIGVSGFKDLLESLDTI